MALEPREVLKSYTFEQQRQEINKLAQDVTDLVNGEEGFESLRLNGDILDNEENAGAFGEFLSSTGDGGVLWKSLKIENVLWVTKDGDDENDGLSQSTAKASIKAALRAATESADGLLGKCLDASNQILLNKKLIQEEVSGWLLSEYENGFTFPNSPPESGRYKDARNLIYKNLDEICDRSLAEIALQYDESTWGTDWIFPEDEIPGRGRFYDAYRLIQLNRSNIIETAYTASGGSIITDPDGTKCKRDIGYFIDAISLDVFLGSVIYARKFTQQYFTGTSLNSYLAGEVPQSVLAFNSARDEMIEAMRNLGVVTDPTVTIDSDTPDCADVASAITTLSAIVTSNLTAGTLSLPAETERDLDVGALKCYRDISYIVRSVANDLYTGGNTNIYRATRKYFDATGNFIFDNGEEVQSVIAFEKAGEMMRKAVTNQLYGKSLFLAEGPEEYDGTGGIIEYGDSGNEDTCIDVQLTIETLIQIINSVISSGDYEDLDPELESEGIWAEYEKICTRDIGYIIDAVASDLKEGGNINCVEAGKAYRDGSNTIYIDGEVTQTLGAFQKARDLMIFAMRNWRTDASETVYKPKYTFIEPYIDESIIADVDSDGNPVFPLCADVTVAINNYIGMIASIINNGVNSVPVQSSSFKTTIFVKSGVYTEENPIILPPNTGIVGDNLREVTIIPENTTDDMFYMNNGSYLTGATFSGHVTPAYVASFPKFLIGAPVTLICSGDDEKYTLTTTNTKDIYPGMSISGNGIGTGAIVTKVLGNTIFVSVAHDSDINSQSILFENYVGSTGVITRSPYIQNCTSITGTGAGLKVDGNLAGGTASFVLDSYTQYNQGGDGIVIVNQGYTQLVSIFEICCNRAVYLSGGSTCSITNSNTDFGNYGLVADGTSPLQYTAKVDGNQLAGTILNVKNLRTKPYVGQVATFGNNGNPYYFIQTINITNGGSGYTTPPSVTITNPTGPEGIPAQAISAINENGEVTSILVIAAGSQFVDPPTVTISSPVGVGITATAEPKMYPQFYSVLTASDLNSGNSTLTFDETIDFPLDDETEIYFYQVTKIIANSHCMEYVGAGTEINKAIPAKGGVPMQEREIVELNGGKVAFTSTDHLGNFRIGGGIQINQNTGTLAGESFERSLFTTVTPFILALS